jgi:hypothetical protein
VIKQLDALPSHPAAAVALSSLLGKTEEGTSADEIAWAFSHTDGRHVGALVAELVDVSTIRRSPRASTPGRAAAALQEFARLVRYRASDY